MVYPFRDRTIILEGVDIVVSRSNTKLSLKQTGSHELKCGRNNELS
jgi:hypothetical protein